MEVARFLTCPRVSWHICDDADGRTPAVDKKGEVYIYMGGFVVVSSTLLLTRRHKLKSLSTCRQTGFAVCRDACRKI